MVRVARPLTQAVRSSVTAQATHSLRSEETSIPNGMNGISLGAAVALTVLPSRLDNGEAAGGPVTACIRLVIRAY